MNKEFTGTPVDLRCEQCSALLYRFAAEPAPAPPPSADPLAAAANKASDLIFASTIRGKANWIQIRCRTCGHTTKFETA